MKKSVSLALAITLGLILAFSSVTNAADDTTSGFLGAYTSKLQPGPEDGAKLRWLDPDVDFSHYNKVMLDNVVFYFAPDSEDKGIDPAVMKELADSFNKELVTALKDKYPIVTEPGPDVIRIRIALTGLKQSSPVTSGISSILPVGLVISGVKKGITGSWVGSGATGGELLFIDTAKSQVVGAAKDEQTAGFTERFSKYGSAEEAFKFWAGRIKTFLDQAHDKK